MLLQTPFDQIGTEFRQYRGLIAEVAEGTNDPSLRQHLSQLLQNMDQAFVKVQEAFPKRMAELEAQQAATQRTINQAQAMLEKGQARLAELQQQMTAAEAAKAAAAAAPRPAMPPLDLSVDPQVAARLRAELLDLFGDPRRKQPGKVSPDAGLDIWEDWTWEEGQGRGPF